MKKHGLLTAPQVSGIAIMFAVAVGALAIATIATSRADVAIRNSTVPAALNAAIVPMTPWGIDWGIGAACYKSNTVSAEISCIKVSPDELELFKKTLEAQRSS